MSFCVKEKPENVNGAWQPCELYISKW